MFQAAIFDLDGTLLDTIYDLASSMNWGLCQFGFPALPLEHHRNAVGKGLRHYSEQSIPQDQIKADLLDSFVATVGDYYQEHCMEQTKVYDGIHELLAYMKEQGISVHVLSNKVDDFVRKLVKHYFDDGVFGCVYGERKNIPKKPNPQAALAIAEEIGVAPSQILFIGDSVYDVITGNAAGMRTIAVSWGYQDEERLLRENPAFLAHSPSEIMMYIKTKENEKEA